MLRILFLTTLAACSMMAADDAKAIEEAERNWAKGVVTQDFALLDKVLADDLIYSHSSGAKDTKQSYIESQKSGAQKYEVLDLSDLAVRLLDKTCAFVTARAKVKSVTKGQRSEVTLALLHVYQKRKGNWQLVAHQSARLP